MKVINYEHEGYLVTTDKELMYTDQIHKWLSEESYWSKHIPYSIVKSSFDNSFCIGVLKGDEQIGFARLITDYASIAYLADVYVIEGHRGKGLSKLMMKILMELDWVKGCRSIFLGTRDAQGLYKQFGFTNPEHPERIMKITRPGIYGDHNNSA